MNDNSGVGSLIFLLALIGGAIWVFWAGGINNAWYSVLYQVTPSKVFVDHKPIDCDFISSPLGAKGCSYEASVSAFNAPGVIVSRNGVATKYARSTEGKPIVSYDGGKNWWPSGAEPPDQQVDRVTVSWIKVRSN